MVYSSVCDSGREARAVPSRQCRRPVGPHHETARYVHAVSCTHVDDRPLGLHRRGAMGRRRLREEVTCAVPYASNSFYKVISTAATFLHLLLLVHVQDRRNVMLAPAEHVVDACNNEDASKL